MDYMINQLQNYELLIKTFLAEEEDVLFENIENMFENEK